MFFKRKFILLAALSATLMVANSCSKEDSLTDDKDPTEELPDTKLPKTNFKFLTVNHSSIYGEAGSISHISHAGISTADIYQQANGTNIPNRINEITRMDNEFCITGGGLNINWYMGGFIQFIDTASFKINRTIDLSYDRTNQELSLNSSVQIGENLLFTAGSTSDDKMIHNMAVISLENGSLVNSFHTDFSVKKIIRVKDKLFLAGTAHNLKHSKIAVLDLNDIQPDAIRVIKESTTLFEGNGSMLQDKNGMIWAAVYDNSGSSVICIDPEKEQVIKTVSLPYAITSLSSIGMAIDAKAKNLYLRSGRAFYQIDTETCVEPDDVIYEITSSIVNGGMACNDLKMGHDGKLLFIHHVSGQGKISEVYELDPANWEVTNKYPTNTNSQFIYIAE